MDRRASSPILRYAVHRTVMIDEPLADVVTEYRANGRKVLPDVERYVARLTKPETLRGRGRLR